MKEQLAALAEARGLAHTARLIADFAAPELLAGRVVADARLGEAAKPVFDDLLGQLVRRGLDPHLILPLCGQLEARPLERALVAWDALNGALFTADDPLLPALRGWAAPLGPVLPGDGRRGIDLNRWPSHELIAASVGHPRKEAPLLELLAGANERRLADLGELLRRGDPLLMRPGTGAALAAFGRLLHLAHLPVTASVFLDFVSRAMGYRKAALDLCETLFDVHEPEKLPGDGIRPGDLPGPDLHDAGEYLIYRTLLALGQPGDAWATLEQNLAKRPANLPPPSARIQVVRAHLQAHLGRGGLRLDRLDRICDKERLWRYAARVRVVVAAKLLPADSPRPFQMLADFVQGFGNDFGCWKEALVLSSATAAWRRDAVQLMVRETLHLPHEPGLWRLLIQITGGSPEAIAPAAAELEARLAAQRALRPGAA
jgi:hypothetical protein